MASRWLAAGAAIVSLAAAVGMAVGPAVEERTSVDWPAPQATAALTASANEPTGIWFTPLLLAAHSPSDLLVEIPCAVVAGVEGPATTFATTRDLGVDAGLRVDVTDGRLLIRLGTEELAASPRESDPACRYLLSFVALGFGEAQWRLQRNEIELANGISAPPVVSGLRSDADPRSVGLHVALTTRSASSHPSVGQWTLTAVALLGAALVLKSTRRRPSSPRAARRGTPRRLDLAVIGTLVVWSLLGPWFFDDGWLMGTVRARSGSGSFSNYFDTLGTQMPLGFVHHVLLWPFAASNAPFLVWRVVPLLACAASWLVMRRVFESTVVVANAPGWAALAFAHLLFSCAWLITLRPEPVVALASVSVLAAVLDYRRHRAPRSLGWAMMVAAVAVTLHPSGLVALAPLALALGPLWQGLRRDFLSVVDLVAMGAGAISVGVLALFADTDLSRWRVDRGLFAGDGFHSRGALDELDRYRDLLVNGSVLALASVLIGAVALAAWAAALVDRRARRTTPSATPTFGAVLLVGVLLLTLTPSKWIYHFGSLSALAALAIAAEASRLGARGRPVDHRRPGAHALAVTIALAFVGARCFSHPVDAQYFLTIGSRMPGPLGSRNLWFAVLLVAVAAGPVRRWISRWSFPVVMAVVLVVSFVSFVAEPLLAGPPWATSRALVGDLAHGGCPVARSIDVSNLDQASRPKEVDGPSTFGRWWAMSADDTDVVVAVRAPAETRGLRVLVTLGRGDPAAREVEPTTVLPVPPFSGSVYGPAPEIRMVRVLRAGAMPAGTSAIALRVVVDGDDRGDARGISLDDPLTIAPRSLASVLRDRTVLVSPPELPLLRCSNPPVLRAGVAAPPDVAIGFERGDGIHEIGELASASGPWFLAHDAYEASVLWAWLTDSDAFAVTLLAPHRGDQIIAPQLAASAN
jgi:hypothetical protein